MRNDNDAAKSSRSQQPTEAFHGMCTACTRTFLFSATPAQRRQRRQRPCASTPRGADARKREEARLQQASGDEPRHSGSRRQRDVEAPGAGSEAELVARPWLLQRKTAHSSVLSCSLGSETRDALLAKNRRRHDATTPRRLRLRQKVRTPRARRATPPRAGRPHTDPRRAWPAARQRPPGQRREAVVKTAPTRSTAKERRKVQEQTKTLCKGQTAKAIMAACSNGSKCAI